MYKEFDGLLNKHKNNNDLQNYLNTIKKSINLYENKKINKFI